MGKLAIFPKYRLDGQSENGAEISQTSEISAHSGNQSKTKLDTTGNLTTDEDLSDFGWWHQ